MEDYRDLMKKEPKSRQFAMAIQIFFIILDTMQRVLPVFAFFQRFVRTEC